MRTVKQISQLTGISVRMLHHYDKIGLLKPSKLTDAGYRLYDEEALQTLQRILYFKELDLSLKEIKEILTNPNFDKIKALENQRKLFLLKRKRLDDLIDLIDKTLKGDNTMSFKAFDMSEYYKTLEEFKNTHKDKVIKLYGSVDKFNDFIEKCKSNEADIAKAAIKQYGSIEKYVKAMKNNLDSNLISNSEQIDQFKKDWLEDNHPKLKELYKELVSDLGKDPSSKEIQQIAEKITITVKEDYDVFKSELGDNYWYYMIQSCLTYTDWINKIDQKYGEGSCKFIGEALKQYLGDNQPKLEILYKKLTTDLNKDPYSDEIQEIVGEIADENKKNHHAINIDEGENYLGYTAELYLSNSIWIKVLDKKYGEGASQFMGKAIKFYSENN